MEPNRGRFPCQFPGCNRSYLRSEHLNRHSLSHRKGAFVCYLCQRRFTRNDLLNAHLRRHEKRGHSASAPSQIETVSSTAVEPSIHNSSPSETSPSDSHSQPPAPAPPNENIERPRQDYAPAQPAILSQYAPALTGLAPPHPHSLVPPSHGHGHSDRTHQYHPASPSEVMSHNSGSSGAMTHNLAQQQFFPPMADDDSTWLFPGTSLFDLPPDDYLNLHFGGALGPASPTVYAQSIQSIAPPLEIPKFTPSDHERMLSECPDLRSTPLNDFAQTSHVLFGALDYCDIYLPLFHRPTLDFTSCPPCLCLAVCCLGAFLSSAPGLHDAGRLAYKHVWSSAVEKALLRSPRVEMCFLQTLILMEHICTYTMGRHEHEMAEIVHSTIVTLASRNNLMTESHRMESGSKQSVDTKWKEWAQRETVIRIAHTIFISDTQYMVFFSHRAELSVGMMKLPLPSHPSLWEARTAADWEILMRNGKKSSRSKYYSLDSAVGMIMSVRESEQKRESIQRHIASNPSSLHYIIHGIASAIGDNKYRCAKSGASPALCLLKNADFKAALAEWKDRFFAQSEADQNSRLSWCSLVMYFFSTVLMHYSLADIQMAAGSAFSSGRAVTPQAAQAAYTRLTANEPVSHESYLRGLEVTILCLEESIPFVTDNSSRPLWQTYCAFLGILILWAHVIGLEKRDSDPVDEEMVLTQFNPTSVISGAAPTLASMYEREVGRIRASRGDVQLIRADLRRLIGTVRDLLVARPWEISHEAARILMSLVERETATTQCPRPAGQNSGPGFSSTNLQYYR